MKKGLMCSICIVSLLIISPVYSQVAWFYSDFSNGVPSQFSGVKETISSVSDYGFSGQQLLNGSNLQSGYDSALPTVLTLKNLPPHTHINLGLLFGSMGSWDSIDGDWGPDFFNIDIDGQTIFSESFCNWAQPYDPNVLLFMKSDSDAQEYIGLYNLGLDNRLRNIEHTADTLVINFYAGGSGWQGVYYEANYWDEWWIIDNVKVELIVNPTEQTEAVVDYIEEYKASGDLVGVGVGNSPDKKMNALINMIESAGDYLEAGDMAYGCQQLQDIYLKVDGVARPADFVSGLATAGLASSIQGLMEYYECP